MSDQPAPPDVILLYRVREGALLGGGSYVTRLPSGRLQTVETQGTVIAPPGQVYYGTDPAVAVHHPGPCPSCDAFTFCDCAEELSEDLENARLAAIQLRRILDEIHLRHPCGCEPGSGRLICETCRQPWPCATVAVMQDAPEPASRVLWEGLWS